MRMIGIIGGMSAESTATYYAALNAAVRARLGGLHSARLLLWSVDFAEIAQLQKEGRWQEQGEILAAIARKLEAAGAEAIVLATNTMHKVAPAIEAAVKVPFLHIAEATAAAIRNKGLKRPALMATAYTMEQDFYKERLARHGLDVIIPDEADRAATHRIIYEELCKGVISETSRAEYIQIAQRLQAKGADCLILGCTEVGMLLNSGNVPMPVFDTTLIHVEAAVDFSLSAPKLMAAE